MSINKAATSNNNHATVNSNNNNTTTHSHAKYLDWTKRPKALQQEIGRAFQFIASNTESRWGCYNGSASYSLCKVKQHELMKKIIQEAPADQKEFYALDIGAGNFQWGHSLACYLNEQTDLPKDIKIHIIGIRGEGNSDEKMIESGRCKIYDLGHFEIENLIDQFKKFGLDLDQKIDLTVSRWCFRHLVDPAGTFSQAYQLLRPKQGILLLDGFFFCYENQSMYSGPGNSNMTQLFIDTQAPFLTMVNNDAGSLNQFMMRKNNTTESRLPMHYMYASWIEEKFMVGSNTVTLFQREPQIYDQEKIFNRTKREHLHGDKNLYEWLKKNRLLGDPSLSWQPLFPKDSPLPPLHQAVLASDTVAVIKCLEEGADIDESDASGNTALHLAIQNQNFELFKLLLIEGADFGLFNSKFFTPLHTAASTDTNGQFIQILLEAGAEINKDEEINYHETPISLAIEEKNIKAVEVLLKNNATLNYTDHKALKSEEFDPIRDLIPLCPSESREFQQIVQHIRQGDCVFLDQYHIFNRKNSESKVQERKKLVIIDIAKDTQLRDYTDEISTLVDNVERRYGTVNEADYTEVIRLKIDTLTK